MLDVIVFIPAHCLSIYFPDYGQETKIKVVWLCLKVFWFSKNNSTHHSEWKKRRRGKQKKRFEDNIKEWTGMDFQLN